MKTFIHIGVPKAASTYIQKYLKNRSEIYHDWMDLADFPLYNSINEEIAKKGHQYKVRVFSQESLSTPLITLDRVSLMPHLDRVKEVRYKVAIQLKKIFPEAEILLILRNYREIIPSMYSELLVMGSTLSKKSFLKKFGKFIIELFHYEQIINTYEEVFGKEKLTIIPFEMLQEDSEKFQSFLSDYFRIDHQNVIIKKENKGISDKMIYRVRMHNLLRLIILFILPKKCKFIFSEKWRKKNIQLKGEKWSVNGKAISFNTVDGFEELITNFKSNNTLISSIESFKKYADDY